MSILLNMDDTSKNEKRKIDSDEGFNPQTKNVYSCDQCRYTANSQSLLNSHKQFIHEGIIYPCDQFKYAATEQGVLKKNKHKAI